MSTVFFYTSINKLYEECRWNAKELEHNCIKAETPMGKMHLLHRRRVGERMTRIVRMLKYCRKDCMRSMGEGMPWQCLRMSDDGAELNLEHADKLIALGMAAGFVTIEQRSVNGIDEKVPYAVIEDTRIKNRDFRYASGRQNFRLKKGWERVKE